MATLSALPCKGSLSRGESLAVPVAVALPQTVVVVDESQIVIEDAGLVSREVPEAPRARLGVAGPYVVRTGFILRVSRAHEAL
ncbi:MAG: hypothetical protein Q8Q09_09265 [Deltaproteobacteria bacterium]|nr:hypothetical protein [Deltaproteobacteria bacterium]